MKGIPLQKNCVCCLRWHVLFYVCDSFSFIIHFCTFDLRKGLQTGRVHVEEFIVIDCRLFKFIEISEELSGLDIILADLPVEKL